MRVGDLLVGVRSNRDDVDATVRTLLAAHVVGDVDAPANYSVWIADRDHANRPAVELHRLYRAFRPIVRSRSSSHVFDGLLRHLDAHLDPAPDVLHLHWLAAVDGDRAALVANVFDGLVDRIQPRLRSRRIRLFDAPSISVDPLTGELLVAEPRLTVDRNVLATVDNHDRAASRELAPVAPGRYAVTGWVTFAPDDNAPSRGAELAGLGGTVADTGGLGGDAVLSGLDRVFSADGRRAADYDAGAVSAAVLDVLGR